MISKKSPALTGLFVFLSLALVGCPSSYQKLSTKPVEKVNDHVLTSREFANQLARRLRQFDALVAKDPNNIHRIKEEILKDFLVKSLTLDWADFKLLQAELQEFLIFSSQRFLFLFQCRPTTTLM